MSAAGAMIPAVAPVAARRSHPVAVAPAAVLIAPRLVVAADIADIHTPAVVALIA
jgi:hypothetical protein